MPELRSLQNLRRLLSTRLGGFGFYTVDEASTSPDTILAPELIGSEDSASAFDNSWIYVTAGNVAPVQRRISAGGYDPDTGIITVTREFGANPSADAEFEIHTKLPALSMNRVTGLNDIINQTLSVLWTVQRIEFPTSSSETFTLEEPWLTNEKQIVDVYRPSSDGYRPYKVGNAYGFEYNADTPFLQGPQNSEEGWLTGVVRPGNTWIKVDGDEWEDSTVGLVSDDDECLFVPQVVIPIALYFAYDALSRSPWVSATEQLYYEKKAIDQARIAYPIKMNYTPEVNRSPAAHGGSHAPNYGMKGLLGW